MISHFTRARIAMSTNTTGGHPDMDYAEHNRTFNGFILGTKILSGFVILLLVGMLVFLV
jgi:Bacterial aa3 type cytochrome c oxidase subunit IV